MATNTSTTRLNKRAESWERVYEAVDSINFTSFDYESVKQSLIDYIKLHYPETFNDYIESSEFIAIIEAFAYIADVIAYRIDYNMHENFIDVARRRDSVLRLAKLISYTAARPIPARGLVKITSVKTTEVVLDKYGTNLANTTIKWADPNNSNWKEQFLLLINKVLTESFGSVDINSRFQFQDVLFEQYDVSMTDENPIVFGYDAESNIGKVPMEIVPLTYDTDKGIIERRPQNKTQFSLMYGNDGLGDYSANTGFFCLTKQGILQKVSRIFDGSTPNQSYVVNVPNINNTDIWVNQVDPTTGQTLDIPSIASVRKRITRNSKHGEWVSVDNTFAQNVAHNLQPLRTKYEIETLRDNSVRLIFGDGEFADIPSGSFDIWVRSSVNEDIVIQRNSVVDKTISFSYTDVYGRLQTFTITFSLSSTLANNSTAETTEHIRRTAPMVYYAKDRMVNNEDYNVLLLRDSSIVKLRSVNRTFAGDSKYIKWHDPTGNYENCIVFGDDGMVYFEDQLQYKTVAAGDVPSLILGHIQPLLNSHAIFSKLSEFGLQPNDINKTFSSDEMSSLIKAFEDPPFPTHVKLFFNYMSRTWHPVKGNENPDEVLFLKGWPYSFITEPVIEIKQTNIESKNYEISNIIRKLIFGSDTTRFWNVNGLERVIDYTTLNSQTDNITILRANESHDRKRTLRKDIKLRTVEHEIITSEVGMGSIDYSKVSTVTEDINNDGYADDITASYPMNGLFGEVEPYTASVVYKGLSDLINLKLAIYLSPYIFQ